MYKKTAAYIIRDMKLKEEWKRKIKRQRDKKKKVEKVEKVVDKRKNKK